MTIGGVDLQEIGKHLVRKIREDELLDEAAAIAYHLLFSVVPLLIFLTSLSSFISRQLGTQDVVDDVTRWLFDHLPASTATAVQEPIQEILTNQRGGLLSFGALFALWGARNAMASLMKGLNVAFNVKDQRPWLRRNLVAIGLTILLGLAMVGSSLVLVLGTTAGEQILGWLGLGDTWASIWLWLRWPIVLLLALIGLAFLYWAGPNADLPFRWLTPGAVVAVVLWLLATLGLGLYFTYAGSYASTYGVLGGVLAFVFWLYVTTMVILVGGEVNAVVLQEHPDADLESRNIAASDHAERQHNVARA